MRRASSAASLQAVPGGLRFEFSYNAAMVAALKSQVPSTARRWDPTAKAWIVAPDYADHCRALAQTYLNITLDDPQPQLLTAAPVTELIQLRYLGATKDRGGDERTAFGHDGKDWRFIFPEAVLREWFGVDASDPTAASTLYAILGIARGATDVEVKRAFKAAARQWHPDVCREDGATQVFQRINEAYQVLSSPKLRARYDAGLVLETTQTTATQPTQTWRPPLRCGWLLVTAIEVLGRLNVSEILQWTDIVQGDRTLVTSWKFGDDTYTERWV